jgi:cysteine desulfurase
MVRRRTYLDHNATSPLRPAAREAIEKAFRDGGNASSVHAEGRIARAIIDDAREAIARELGVLSPMLVFTSGGSEANNLAIKGAAVDRLLVSAVEHPSVLESARAAGKPVEIVPVDRDGIIDLVALDRMLAGGPRALVSIMLANNETGVIEPLRQVSEIGRRHGALIHTDAVQAFGKIPVNFGVLGIDLLTVSAHKLGGPVGAGALIVRDGVSLEPLIHGGGQELRRRAGTENLPAIAGFAAAAAERRIDVSHLRDRLESELEDAVVVGSSVERLPNVTCLAWPGLSAEMLVMAFDLDGIAISSGSACSSGKVAKSHVLAAMDVAPEIADGAIRVSLGWNTTEEDIDRFIQAARPIIARGRARIAA